MVKTDINSKCEELFFLFIFKGHMRHKDLMVGRNPHFETKNSYLKSIKGIADGSQRYVALASSKYYF